MGNMEPLQIETLHGQAAQTIHNYGPIYFLCLPPVQTPLQTRRSERRARPRPSAAEAQREVLALMDLLPDPAAAVNFMEREFDTRLVAQLKPPQLYRVRRYVEAILSRMAAKR